MKKMIPVLALALMSFSAFSQVKDIKLVDKLAHHGGGNGGDELELELKKRSLQIGQFIKSEMGKKVFKMINADAVVETVNSSDINVVEEELYDKHGVLRTCLNFPARQLIECNLKRMLVLRSNEKQDILTATLFHEILGLMEVELGHQENVSAYPISSKMIPYSAIVTSTPIIEGDIRPEYYGLDNRGYGITYVNKKTNETVRLICTNNNVEIHRCNNLSMVRSSNGMQAPVNRQIPSLTRSQISKVYLKLINPSFGPYGVGKEKRLLKLVTPLFNQANDLSLMGKTQRLSNKKYQLVMDNLPAFIKNIQEFKQE